jgi:hypothetical protein
LTDLWTDLVFFREQGAKKNKKENQRKKEKKENQKKKAKKKTLFFFGRFLSFFSFVFLRACEKSKQKAKK